MKIITANFPEQYLEAIAALIGNSSLYHSRSELIRNAIKDFLIRELESAQRFTDLQPETLPVKQSVPDYNDDIYIRIPVNDITNITMEYKTYRIIKK